MARQETVVFPTPTESELEKIITDPEGAELLVRYADQIGNALSRQLTTSQIRAIFGEVHRIEGVWKTDPQQANRSLVLLKPKMAYRATRERGRGVADLVSILTPAIDYVQGDNDHFTRFVDFFEAILAYHRAHGGRA